MCGATAEVLDADPSADLDRMTLPSLGWAEPIAKLRAARQRLGAERLSVSSGRDLGAAMRQYQPRPQSSLSRAEPLRSQRRRSCPFPSSRRTRSSNGRFPADRRSRSGMRGDLRRHRRLRPGMHRIIPSTIRRQVRSIAIRTATARAAYGRQRGVKSDIYLHSGDSPAMAVTRARPPRSR